MSWIYLGIWFLALVVLPLTLERAYNAQNRP